MGCGGTAVDHDFINPSTSRESNMSSTTKRSYARTIFTAIVGTCVALIALAAPASASGPSGHQVPVGFVWQNNSSIYNQTSPNGRNVLSLVQEDPATVELAVRHDNSA